MSSAAGSLRTSGRVGGRRGKVQANGPETECAEQHEQVASGEHNALRHDLTKSRFGARAGHQRREAGTDPPRALMPWSIGSGSIATGIGS